jgi:glycosyltransferase involved in cell wall biosynthesis
MIESLACGTPVIGWRNGSVPELIRDGFTGFVVETVDEAIRAVNCVGRLSRQVCRNEFEKRFDAARMAEDYIQIYRNLPGFGTKSKDRIWRRDERSEVRARRLESRTHHCA